MTNYEHFYQRLNSSEIPALNGVRFIAVFLVIFYHLNFQLVPGGHGVMLFFVLSGFLITWLLLKENEKTNTISLKHFFQRRVIRIFPAFYAYWLIAVAILLILKKDVPWGHAISSLFYFSNYYGALHPELNNLFSHTWSLAIEEQFYLCFPFLFFAFANNLKRFTNVLTVIILTIWIWRFILVFGFQVKDSYIYSAFDTRIDQLLVGCLLAMVLRQGKLKNFWEAALKNALMPLLPVALLLLSIFFGSMNSVVYKDTVGFMIEPVLMAIIIAQLILFSASFWWKWLEWRTVKYLGMISYSLYLYQQLTLYSVTKVLSDFSLIVQVVCAVSVTIIAATFSYYAIEKPFLRLKNTDFNGVLTIFWTRIKAHF
jgi:peptidoglycan/LPS O-acetylase OafA/YrhL